MPWAALTLLLLYPLALGPLNWLYVHSDDSDSKLLIHRVVRVVYFPVDCLTDHSKTAYNVVDWYVSLWMPPRR